MDQIEVSDKTFTAASASDVFEVLEQATSSNGDRSHSFSTSVKWPFQGVPRITTYWEHLNWRQALDDLCQKADLYWQITDTHLSIAPRETKTEENERIERALRPDTNGD